MPRNLWCCTVLLLLSGLIHPQATAENVTVPTASQQQDLKKIPEVAKVAAANNQFGLNLYDKVKKIAGEGNIAMSPYSVSSVLALVTAGAKGTTLKQLQEGLKYPAPDHIKKGYSTLIPTLHSTELIKIESANAVFLQEGLAVLDSYKKDVKTLYSANVQSVDFNKPSSVTMINNFVKEKTNDKIKDIIVDKTLPGVKMALVNALYFKGDWAKKFDKSLTRAGPFHITPNKTVNVSMMMQKNEFNQTTFLGATILEIPYKGGRFSMFVVVPEDKKEPISKIEDKIRNQTGEFLAKLDSSQLKKKSAYLYIPKFKISASLQLQDRLKELGIKVPFQAAADFSGISSSKNIQLDKVIQKVVIEVNEEGSEAAAATVVTTVFRSAMTYPDIRLDRPFLFFIKDSLTGMILFQGRVSNPGTA